MLFQRCAVLGGSLVAVLFLISGAAFAAKSYPDRVGEVKSGAGPDIVSVTVSNTKTKVTFSVRFVKAPPLRVNQGEGWIDMLLTGIDVPPLGPRPVPGGEWLGANFAAGTHGPSRSGQMVRLGQGVPANSRRVATFGVVTIGSTLTFSIPRRALGNPAWFTFEIAAARELEVEEATGPPPDFAPARGTFRYTLTG
jgi:hypothetical protein